MKKFLVVFIIAIQIGYGQVHPVDHCATMEQDSLNRLRFPQRGTLQAFENVLGNKIEEIELRARTGRTMNGILNIPIIFHIVHNGEPVGTGTNLSQAQIMAQLEVVNEDFRRKPGTPGFNNDPNGADIEIEFCLSPIDEDGNAMAEPGIHRYDGGKASWSREEIEGSLKPSTIWNPNLFYNIWTVNFSATDATLLGYAQFPDQSNLPGLNEKGGPATTDGVVVSYKVCGSVTKGTFPVMEAPYNRGRTLVHETGHWLGLRHIWGDGPCADDFVADTPTADGPNRGCPVGRVSCGNTNMPQNYMDYSDDACMNIFTKGQKTRMLAVMELSPRRNNLVQANLCSPVVVAAPDANFTSDKQFVLLGGEVSFTDLSSNFPTSWSWTFEGGDPSSSTVRNPKVTYNVPGIYTVTLVATNTIGSSTPQVRTGYIEVSEEGLCSAASNFLGTFTPSLIKLNNFGNYTGYLTGHNSKNDDAYSEFFLNTQGYAYVSGVRIRFGKAVSIREDAQLFVTVWNARGPQSGPGAVIEKKPVLYRQIIEDIAAGRSTEVVFARETPVFSQSYHVGIEIEYLDTDSIAVVSSANGEATQPSSWVKHEDGRWQPLTIAYGANIAMDITPLVGVNPSVQVGSSQILISPGQEVVLNGRGASIFVWNASNGTVENFNSPQLVVNPLETTTYTVIGSGLDLCITEASQTIYVSGEATAIRPEAYQKEIMLAPNPGDRSFQINLENDFSGSLRVNIYTTLGQLVKEETVRKEHRQLSYSIDTSDFPPGMYMVFIEDGSSRKSVKWIKR